MEPQINPIQIAEVVSISSMLSQEEKGINTTFHGIVLTNTGIKHAYIKLLPGKQLINEVACTIIGQAIGLPIPPGYLVNIYHEDLPFSFPFLKSTEKSIAYASCAVGVPDLRRRINSNYDEKIFSQFFLQWKDWQNAIIFDEWVANIDRNLGNILIGKPSEVWLIDHGHSFTGPNWGKSGLKPNGIYRNQLADWIIPILTEAQREELRIKNNELAKTLKKFDFEIIINASFGNTLLEYSEQEALKFFLINRIDYIITSISARLGILCLDMG